ncbi:MAG: PPC domain-containing protein, partial [Planctomycetes bacterium]|nr:PPC domain-containing protein [Planctomycetota bacterium]
MFRPSARFRSRFLVLAAAAAACLAGLGTASAQLPQTRLYSLFPAGGKAGATVEVQVTRGDDIDELQRLIFSHPGIKAEPKMQEENGEKKPVANTFVVTIDGGVPPGFYELRAVGRFGLSNPRRFEVGKREEVPEAEPNNEREQAQALPLNQVINGQAGGGADVDWFKLAGKAGQRVVLTARAARLDSRMEGVIWLFNASGDLLGYSDNQIRRDPDPLLDITLPADGEYFVKLHDTDFRGGSDYFYRLLASTAPHIDFIMPPAGAAGTTADYTLYGRNLPGGQPAGVTADGAELQKLAVKIALPAQPTLDAQVAAMPVEAGMDGISYSLDSPEGTSNPVMLYFATAPVVLETEPNNEPAQAQKVTVPVEIAGQSQQPADVDVYQFDAKAGEVLYVEVFGQRVGTTLDPYLVVEQVTTTDTGEEQVKRLQAVDDDNTNLYQNVFDTNTDDP